MGVATLGRPGDTVTFRIDPNEVQWNWKVNTNVQDTVGGRVVQIVGCTLSDITVQGSYGEDHSVAGSDSTDTGPGRSWVLAERFIRRVRKWMDYQSTHPNYYSKTPPNEQDVNPTLRFTYPLYGWDFEVYVKDINDAGGNVVEHRPGKFSYQYTLTLFVVQENSTALGILRGQAARAAESFIERIAKGIGWERYDPKTGSFAEHIYSGYDPQFDKARALSDFQSIYSGGSSDPGGGQTPDPSSGDANAGGPFTATDIARIAYAAGFREGQGYQGHGLIWAVAVSLAESGGKPGAQNVNSDGSIDRGLWQINNVWHPEVSDEEAYHAASAAAAAFQISNGGDNWKAWATFSPNGPQADSPLGTSATLAGKQYANAAAGVRAFMSGNTGTHPAALPRGA